VQLRCRVDYRLAPKEYSDKDRIVARGEWLKPELWYEFDIDDMLLYAGKSGVVQTLNSIAPFDLKSLVAYKPEFLVDWQAETYQLSLADAAQEAYKRMRDRAMRAFDSRGVIQDYTQFLNNDIVVAQRTYKLILLPIWVGVYTYRGKTYQVVINGQTGKAGGEKPIDLSTIILTVIIALVILGLILWLGILVLNRIR
jgi:hypothetical protein